MKLLKLMILVGFSVVVLLASLFLNVVFHEVGHYAVASAFELEPEMNVRGVFVSYAHGNLSYSGAGNPEAQVSYIDPNYGVADALVAFAGPFVNILLTVAFLGLYYMYRNRDEVTKVMILLLLIPSILSVVFNLIPISGTDGAAVLSALG